MKAVFISIALVSRLVLCSGDELAADQTVIVHEKKTVETVPGPPGGYPWALLIDAGSTGSRMHLYEWAPRDFHTLPPPISMPFTSEKWTVRRSPGISQYFDNPKGVTRALLPLINYAKSQLEHVKDQWGTFPIFLKATAGMRELPLHQRVAIMDEIQRFFADNKTCPFLFTSIEQARVISGEEEAAYAWAGVNFVTGALLESSWGSGTATPVDAFGTLEMGGASHQIAFFQPEQSILANLFKLQIGGQKHWNLYAHSHLQYGRVSAKDRMWSHLAQDAGCFNEVNGSLQHCEFVDACLPQGLRAVPFNSVSGRAQVHPPMEYQPLNTDVLINSIKIPHHDHWDGCLKQLVEPLGFGGLERETRNKWCNYTHLGQCSFAGVYQPSIPDRESPYGQFILIGGYVHVHRMLKMNSSTFSLRQLKNRASEICALDYNELLDFYGLSEEPDHENKIHSFGDIDVEKRDSVEQLCFLSSYAFAILHHGHGFELDRNFTVIETMEYAGATLKVGWQLGAILYEINSLPWTYSAVDLLQSNTPQPYSSITGSLGLGNGVFFLFVCLMFLSIWVARVTLKHQGQGKQMRAAPMIELPTLSSRGLPFTRSSQYQTIN